jgi:hypothetical protein
MRHNTYKQNYQIQHTKNAEPGNESQITITSEMPKQYYAGEMLPRYIYTRMVKQFSRTPEIRTQKGMERRDGGGGR